MKPLSVRLALLLHVLLCGCYYEVRDGRTGRLYYTDEWVAADGYRGPLTITDETGMKVRIQNAEVVRLNRQDYLDAVSAAEGDSNP